MDVRSAAYRFGVNRRRIRRKIVVIFGEGNVL
jgi:hypothetical protein